MTFRVIYGKAQSTITEKFEEFLKYHTSAEVKDTRKAG